MSATKDRLVNSNNAWALLGALFITAGFLLTINIAGGVDDKYVTGYLAFVGLFIQHYLGKEKTMRQGAEMNNKLDRVLNGEMDDKIRNAVRLELESNGLVTNSEKPSETLDG